MHRRPDGSVAATIAGPNRCRPGLGGPGRCRIVSIVALACAGCFGPAHAERWTLDPNVSTRATWTDNAGFENQVQAHSDTLLEIAPSISLVGEGKRFSIRGTAAATALGYVNGTQDNRVLPKVDLNAKLEAIERFFFIEAGVVSGQAAQDAFAPRADGTSSVNTITTTQYRVAPSFQGRLGGDVNYKLRSNNTWTDVSGASGTDAAQDGVYLGEHVLRIERAPMPFGWALEGARSDTRFESGLPPRATIDSGRLVLSYAVTEGLSFGLRGGYERTNLTLDESEHTIYGADMTWRPTERTNLNGLWEDRFFGHAWRLGFDHRRPRIAWSLGISRDVQSFPQSFLSLPPTDNVAALLDAAFTTRFPDPTERSRIVADLIARQGLPASLATQTSLFSQRVSIVTARNASIVFTGVRNSLAFAVFSSKTEDLPDSIFSEVAANSLNLEQQGGSITYSHQISSVTSLNITGSIARTSGVGSDQGLESKQRSLRTQVTRQLTAKTSAFVGARVQRFRSNVGDSSTVSSANVPPGNATEHAAFLGLSHRF